MLEAAMVTQKLWGSCGTKREERVRNLRWSRTVEFTCMVCGKKGIDHSGGSKKYCSDVCARKGRKNGKGDPCPHNVGVECGKKDCAACGWNPEVSKARMDRILGVST